MNSRDEQSQNLIENVCLLELCMKLLSCSRFYVDDSSTDCNPHRNWGSGTNMCPSMALRVISVQVVKGIDIGRTSHTYRNGV